MDIWIFELTSQVILNEDFENLNKSIQIQADITAGNIVAEVVPSYKMVLPH